MSDNSEDLELFHYGVKGMKWGVRRPVGADGLIKGAKKVGSTVAEAKARDNDARIRMHKKYRDKSGGKLMNASSFLDRKILGEKRFKKYQDRNIKALESQNDRIRSGKTTVLDKIDIAMNTPAYRVIQTARS